MYLTVYNADMEEPRCDRCDNINSPCEWCEEYCGPEHGWNAYERTVEEDEEQE